jgi:hypothetical protein
MRSIVAEILSADRFVHRGEHDRTSADWNRANQLDIVLFLQA